MGRNISRISRAVTPAFFPGIGPKLKLVNGALPTLDRIRTGMVACFALAESTCSRLVLRKTKERQSPFLPFCHTSTSGTGGGGWEAFGRFCLLTRGRQRQAGNESCVAARVRACVCVCVDVSQNNLISAEWSCQMCLTSCRGVFLEEERMKKKACIVDEVGSRPCKMVGRPRSTIIRY